MTKVNKKYKDRLFRLVFNSKEELLVLYNTVNNSNYMDPDELEITTIEDAIYMGMKNDISFILDDILNLYEHQSTFNPNLPVRGLFYLASLYKKHIKSRALNTYGSKLVKLPVPRYIIFYNGQKDEPDRMELRLSDAFQENRKEDACLEVKAVLLNINLGHNKELMEKCRTLREYAVFVSRVRYFLDQGKALEEAVDSAADECIKNGVLSELLSTHRAEVQDLLLTEYNDQEHIAMERKEAKEEGVKEGLKKGLEKGRILDSIEIIRNMAACNITIEEAAKLSKKDIEFVQKIYTMIKEHPDWDDAAIYEALCG